VSVEELDRAGREARDGGVGVATADDLTRETRAKRDADAVEPYYRSYAAADGFLVLACLNERQREAAANVLGLEDPWAANPQAVPRSEGERKRREALVEEFERRLAADHVGRWVKRFRTAGVPAAEVRLLDHQFEHAQVTANGLVQAVRHQDVGEVKLLGSVFKIDGSVPGARRGIPGLGEHTDEVLAGCREAAR
jgi:crotonobetainyl-CoA:carnitine CoA-transferase CaiB-like acyl-CoA transferase